MTLDRAAVAAMLTSAAKLLADNATVSARSTPASVTVTTASPSTRSQSSF
ncbi:hypothetical protein [Dysosmobacter sp. Sow4_B12]